MLLIPWVRCRQTEYSHDSYRFEKRCALKGGGGILTKATLMVLAVDIGGTNVKILATGQTEPRKFAPGKDLTPRKMPWWGPP
jgi:hypothetical protein